MRLLITLCTLACAVALQAGGVYFTDRATGNSAIRAIDFGTASPRTLGCATDPRGVVFDAVTNRVYFADRGSTGSLNSYQAAGSGFASHLTNLPSVTDLRPD